MNEIGPLIEEFERKPENPDVQIRILNLVSKISNVSELVQKIMERCTSKSDKKSPHAAFGAVGTYDFSTGKRQEVSASLTEAPGPLGELHSEHLYLAARCIGCAQFVEEKAVDLVINRLLSEFDLEITFPKAAIAAFKDIGERAISALMQYLKDRRKETFSREDAALALGAIGTDLVVEQLTTYLWEADYDDKAMPFYALGKTRNPKARKPILDFLNFYPNHPKTWVAQNALGEIPSS